MFALLSSLLLPALLVFVPASARRQQQAQATGATQQADDESQASPAAREALRRLRTQKTTYRVGYSSAVEVNVKDLADIEIPPDLPKTLRRVKAESARRLAATRATVARFNREHANDKLTAEWDLYGLLKADFQKRQPGQSVPPTVNAIAPYIAQFDWQKYLHFQVLDQRPCNSCWAFAAVAAFQSNTRLQSYQRDYTQETYDPQTGASYAVPAGLLAERKFSEQYLIDCINPEKGDCNAGGWPGSAFDFMVTNGLLSSYHPPTYTGTVGPCEAANKRADPADKKVRAAAWGYVAYPPKNPTVLQIKRALLEHGPVVALVRIDAGKKFQSYQGGVFNEHDAGAPNHAILIIGWDDALKAWHIQNSWGVEWGEQGFMWIAYDSNGIGQYATWVEAPFRSEVLL
jgi:cathepsin L